MEHISWDLTDTVSQMTHWIECFAPLFVLWVEHFYVYSFQFCIVVISSEDDMALLFGSFESQGQLEDAFGSIENLKTPLFMHVGQWRKKSYLQA